MKRSMTPLHSGSPTYDGVSVIPNHFTSLIHASAMYCGHRQADLPDVVLPDEGTVDCVGDFLCNPPCCRTRRPLKTRMKRVSMSFSEGSSWRRAAQTYREYRALDLPSWLCLPVARPHVR